MIKKVTITGADDSIRPEILVELKHEYPFVEFGILISRKNFGSKRFPSKTWLNHLLELAVSHSELCLSAHLCGAYVRELLLGKDSAMQENIDIFPMFDRVQINTHGVKHETGDFVSILNKYPHEYIFQFDNINKFALIKAMDNDVKCSTLFDLSHGTGILPSEWPKPIHNLSCGYAGGLSPENLESQIIKIEQLVGDTPIWIDMETHVRSMQDQLFDLVKVVTCLDISKKYVK